MGFNSQPKSSSPRKFSNSKSRIILEQKIAELDVLSSTRDHSSSSENSRNGSFKHSKSIKSQLTTKLFTNHQVLPVFRVVLMGPGGVGKTSLITRFMRDSFSVSYQPTIDDMYSTVVQTLDGSCIQFELIDTSGIHVFPAMRELRIKMADALVLVFSLSSAESMNELFKMYEDILQSKITCKQNIFIVGNKSDDDEATELDLDVKAQDFFQHLKSTSFIRTSAQTGENVLRLFNSIFKPIIFKSSFCDTKESVNSISNNSRNFNRNQRGSLSLDESAVTDNSKRLICNQESKIPNCSRFNQKPKRRFSLVNFRHGHQGNEKSCSKPHNKTSSTSNNDLKEDLNVTSNMTQQGDSKKRKMKNRSLSLGDSIEEEGNPRSKTASFDSTSSSTKTDLIGVRSRIKLIVGIDDCNRRLTSLQRRNTVGTDSVSLMVTREIGRRMDPRYSSELTSWENQNTLKLSSEKVLKSLVSQDQQDSMTVDAKFYCESTALNRRRVKSLSSCSIM